MLSDVASGKFRSGECRIIVFIRYASGGLETVHIAAASCRNVTLGSTPIALDPIW